MTSVPLMFLCIILLWTSNGASVSDRGRLRESTDRKRALNIQQHGVFKVFQGIAEEVCKPRCTCANNTEDLTDRFCCDCPDQQILNDCANRNCKAACTNDGGNTYECCHCPSPPPTGGCFSAKSTAKLATGKTITMAELKIGDKVKTVLPSGKVSYSPVKAFLKKQQVINKKYISITTSCNKTIRLTGNHLIYARMGSASKFDPMYANKVFIGAEVLVQGNDELTAAKVIDVSSALMQGAYVPLVTEGNIIVDGVLASCYADFDHDLADLFMTPMQRFSESMELIFGEDAGFPVFVNTARELGMLLLPDVYFWQF